MSGKSIVTRMVLYGLVQASTGSRGVVFRAMMEKRSSTSLQKMDWRIAGSQPSIMLPTVLYGLEQS